MAPGTPFNGRVGQARSVATHGDEYADRLRQAFPKQNGFDAKLLIDCSQGAYSRVVRRALQDYRMVHFIHDEPDGSNINFECGALEPDLLLQNVRRDGFDYGIAFDGDGDRAVFVSSEYGVVETEKLMLLLAQQLR